MSPWPRRLPALFFVVSCAASAAEAAPSLVVNGEVLPPSALEPQKRDHEWMLPAAPIAERLDATLTFDFGTQSVTVTNAVDGAVLAYDGTSGEIRRDGTLRAALLPAMPAGADERDLLLPVSLVAVLFDAHVSVNPNETEIVVVTRYAGGIVTPYASVGVQELRYQGYANRSLGRTDAGLSLDAEGRAGDMQVLAFTSAQVVNGAPVAFRSYGASFLEGANDAWHVGTLRGRAPVSWLNSYGRGARWDGERGGGTQRVSAGVLQLSEGNRARGPAFGRVVVSASAEWGARAGSPLGQAVSVGTAWMEGDGDGEAAFVSAAQFRHASARVKWRSAIGGTATRGVALGDALGAESVAEWIPRRNVRMHATAGHFGAGFRTPSRVFSEANTSKLSGGSTWSPFRNLTASASHSTTWRAASPGNPRSRSHYTFGSMTWSSGSSTFQSATLGATRADVVGHDTELDGRLDVRGFHPWGPWFVSARARLRPVAFPASVSAGFGIRTRVGAGQLTSLFDGNALSGVAASWTQAFQRLRLTLGGRWTRRPNESERPLLADVRVFYNILGSHDVDVAVDEQPYATTSRVGWRGRFSFATARDARDLGGAAPRHVGRVRGRVYVDRNLNGVYDDGDRPLAGVRVRLDNGRFQTVTDAGGEYRFADVDAGRHDASLVLTTIRADLSLLSEGSATLSVPSFTTVTRDFRAGVNRAVSGLVFEDDNGNGRRDGDEAGAPEVRLFLSGGSDTITNGDGTFRLGDVPPGVHTIRLDRTSLDGRLDPGPIQIRVGGERDPEPLSIPLGLSRRPVRHQLFRHPAG